MAKQWEYQSVILKQCFVGERAKITSTLSEQGRQGWELVAMFPFRDGSNMETHLYFKREVDQDG